MPPSETVASARDLLDALSTWQSLAEQLRDLSRAQRDALAEPGGALALDTVLARKEEIFREAQAVSQRVLALETNLPAPESRLYGPWEEAARLRTSVYGLLMEVADLEAQAQAALARRMRAIQGELESLHHGRTAVSAYGGGRSAAPRFLDQRR